MRQVGRASRRRSPNASRRVASRRWAPALTVCASGRAGRRAATVRPRRDSHLRRRPRRGRPMPRRRHRRAAARRPKSLHADRHLRRAAPHPAHPPSLLLITPFMLLSVPLAGLLWDLLALVALFVALALIAGELRLRLRPWQAAALIAFVAVWPPLLNTLLNSQISPLLLLLFVLAWRWARHGRSAAAGAALGLATALRLFPGLLIVYFALRRDWRLVGASLATFTASSLILLPFIGPGAYWDYIAGETPAATADWIASQHNTSLVGLAYHLLGANTSAATLLGRLLTAALLLALVALTWMRRRIPFVRDEATFLAYVPAALLATPILWQHYFVVLLLPLAAARRSARDARRANCFYRAGAARCDKAPALGRRACPRIIGPDRDWLRAPDVRLPAPPCCACLRRSRWSPDLCAARPLRRAAAAPGGKDWDGAGRAAGRHDTSGAGKQRKAYDCDQRGRRTRAEAAVVSGRRLWRRLARVGPAHLWEHPLERVCRPAQTCRIYSLRGITMLAWGFARRWLRMSSVRLVRLVNCEGREHPRGG